jgi:hypothetical protein
MLQAVFHFRLLMHATEKERASMSLTNDPLQTLAIARNLPFFEGFPYLLTRVMPAVYHALAMPGDWERERLVEAARYQARANRLDTCLLLSLRDALFIGTNGNEAWLPDIPRGGIILCDLLRPGVCVPKSDELSQRQQALRGFAKQRNYGGYLVGNIRDAKDDVREATGKEIRSYEGNQANGVPVGLVPCPTCREWRGHCLLRPKEAPPLLVRVRCLCENDTLCARCLFPFSGRRVDSIYFSKQDNKIWHVPGFTALGHKCKEVCQWKA